MVQVQSARGWLPDHHASCLRKPEAFGIGIRKRFALAVRRWMSSENLLFAWPTQNFPRAVASTSMFPLKETRRAHRCPALASSVRSAERKSHSYVQTRWLFSIEDTFCSLFVLSFDTSHRVADSFWNACWPYVSPKSPSSASWKLTRDPQDLHRQCRVPTTWCHANTSAV